MPHLSSYQMEKNVISLPSAYPAIAAIEVIRQMHHRAEHELKHGWRPFLRGRLGRNRPSWVGVGGGAPGVASAMRSRDWQCCASATQIRQVDQSEQRPRPKDMFVGKERDQPSTATISNCASGLVRMRSAAMQFPYSVPTHKTSRQERGPSPPSGCPNRRRRMKRQMVGLRMHAVRSHSFSCLTPGRAAAIPAQCGRWPSIMLIGSRRYIAPRP